jgi:formate dehydrogenase gamma subunit
MRPVREAAALREGSQGVDSGGRPRRLDTPPPQLEAVPAKATPSGLAVTNPVNLVSIPVIAVFDQTEDIRTFRLARPRGFDFQAGQYLTVSIPIDGKAVTRRYSISSAPESADYLEISVKRQGRVSAALHSTVGVGSLLTVEPPAGRFVYPAGDSRHLVLLAGGVGCTPLMSMLCHAVACDPSRPVTFLLSVRTVNDIPFRSELALLRRQHPQVRVGVTLTREDRRPALLAGRIDEALLRRAAPDPANTLFYVCGPLPMIVELKRLLLSFGVPAIQIHWETFDNAETTPRSTAAAAVTAEPVPSDGDPSSSHQFLQFPRTDQFRQILRFARGEMMLHWAIAVPFMICFLTGAAMKVFYNLHSESLFREVLSFLHRVSGGCLAVFPALAVARNWRDYRVLIYNVKIGFTWTIDDLKWLFLVGPATVSRRIVLPEQRKFNAAERMNFMMVMITYPLFVLTGAFLWWHGVDHFLPWLLHISMSLVAPLLMMGHIYMAVVNPSTRVGLSGMITGRVDREWAKHHYKRWYNDHFEEDGTPKKQGPAAP